MEVIKKTIYKDDLTIYNVPFISCNVETGEYSIYGTKSFKVSKLISYMKDINIKEYDFDKFEKECPLYP